MSISDEMVRAAMAGMSRPEDPPQQRVEAQRVEAQRAEQPRADPVASEARFSRPRPGSRSLPAPPKPLSAQIEPLTTGVVPGVEGAMSTGMLRDGQADGPGPYTTELMMDGLDEKSKAMLRARKQPSAVPTPTYTPPPPNPTSQRLPEVEMPPADTGRARPLSAKPRASAWRPPPAQKPERPPQAPEPNDDLTSARPPGRSGNRSLEDLLALADEPPEREDTVSGKTIDLIGVDAAADLAEAAAEPVPAKPPSYPPPSRAPTPLRPLSPPPPEPEEGSLTGSLELLDEADPVLMPSDAMDDATVARPELRAEARPRPAPPVEDPLATRPIPRLPDSSPSSSPAPSPPAAPAPRPAAKAEDKPRVPDSAQLRRETYKPKDPNDPPAPAPAEKAEKPNKKSEKAEKPSKPSDREYREPILAWLASIIGLILIGGGVVIFFVVVAWLMA